MTDLEEAKNLLDTFLKERGVYEEYYNTDDGSNQPDGWYFHSAISACGFSWRNTYTSWAQYANEFRHILYNYPHLRELPLPDVLATEVNSVSTEEAIRKLLDKLGVLSKLHLHYSFHSFPEHPITVAKFLVSYVSSLVSPETYRKTVQFCEYFNLYEQPVDVSKIIFKTF